MAWSFKLVVLTVLAVVSAQRQAPLPLNRGNQNSLSQNGDGDADADIINGDEIPGVAGLDYPVLSEAPRTDFSCDLLKVPGYYADQQAGCQVYYRCQTSGKGVATLCPNGTVFNQETLVCDWWYNVDCSRALDSYKVNEDIALEMAAIDASNPNAGGGIPTLAALAGRLPVLGSRLRNPVTVSPFSRANPFARANLFARANPFSRANNFAAPARYSQNAARDSENSSTSSSDGNTASQRYNDSAKGKGDKKNDYKSDKEFDGYSYPNPNGIDRSYLPPSK